MKIGFSGTQTGMAPMQKLKVRELIFTFTFDEAHHGDCIGSDEEFHDIIRELFPEVKIIIHPPIIATKRAFCEGDRVRIPESYIVRNHNIVDETDVLLATPKGSEELRSGTWATIRWAKKRKRHIFIVYPDGRIENG